MLPFILKFFGIAIHGYCNTCGKVKSSPLRWALSPFVPQRSSFHVVLMKGVCILSMLVVIILCLLYAELSWPTFSYNGTVCIRKSLSLTMITVRRFQSGTSSEIVFNWGQVLDCMVSIHQDMPLNLAGQVILSESCKAASLGTTWKSPCGFAKAHRFSVCWPLR